MHQPRMVMQLHQLRMATPLLLLPQMEKQMMSPKHLTRPAPRKGKQMLRQTLRRPPLRMGRQILTQLQKAMQTWSQRCFRTARLQGWRCCCCPRTAREKYSHLLRRATPISRSRLPHFQMVTKTVLMYRLRMVMLRVCWSLRRATAGPLLPNLLKGQQRLVQLQLRKLQEHE